MSDQQVVEETQETTQEESKEEVKETTPEPKVSLEEYNKLKKDHDRLAQVHDEMKQRKEKQREKELKEKGKFEELFSESQQELSKIQEEIKTAKSEAIRYREALEGYLETEVASVPETIRDLIPEGDVISRLEWIAKAKTSGIMKPTSQPPQFTGSESEESGWEDLYSKTTP